MTAKLAIVLCGIFCSTQTQSFFIQTMGSLGDLQTEILQSKFNLISTMTTARLELQQFLLDFSTDQIFTRKTFDGKLLNLTSQIQTISQSKPINMACLANFGLEKSEIQEKINNFTMYDANEEILAIRNDMTLLNKMIGVSSKIIWSCKIKFPLIMAQMEELRECVKNQFVLNEGNIQNLKLKIDGDIEGLKLRNRLFFEDTTITIDSMIENARNDFSSCLSLGGVI